MCVESPANRIDNQNFEKYCFDISVALVTKPFAIQVLIIRSGLSLLINSRCNPTIELFLSLSASNNI